jgi:hypothetical protein
MWSQGTRNLSHAVSLEYTVIYRKHLPRSKEIVTALDALVLLADWTSPRSAERARVGSTTLSCIEVLIIRGICSGRGD